MCPLAEERTRKRWLPQRPLHPTHEHVTLGHALLSVQDPQFLDGYTSGYLRYCRHDVAQPLSDTNICALLTGRQRNTTHTAIWNAGYIMGWITATHGIPRVQHVCKPRRQKQQAQMI